MSSSSNDAPPRRFGVLGRAWGAVSDVITGRDWLYEDRRQEAERVRATWGIDPTGQQTRDPAERVTVPAATPEGRGIGEPNNDAPALPVVQEAPLPVSADRDDYKAHVAALRAEGANPVANGWTRDETLAMASYLDEKTGLTMDRSEPSDADYARAEAMADPTHPMHDEQREAEADAFKEPPAPDRGSQPRDERTLLAVPFAQKDEAKQAGARWDGTARAWFIPPGMDRTPFEVWLPENVRPADPVAEFGAALRAAGLRVERPEMDGKLHRVTVDGDRGREKSGAYVGYLDGWPAGFIQNFKGEKLNWSMPGRPSREGGAAGLEFIKEREARKAMEQEQRAREHRAASDLALSLWNTATSTQGLHPYLARKGVDEVGLRVGAPGQVIEVTDGKGADGQERLRAMSIERWLIVPVETAEGSLSSLQFISPRGGKVFLRGGKMQGGHHVIGQVGRTAEPILICEGVATGKTLHALTGMPAVVAFNAGNLREVAQAFRAQFPDRAIYIAGDNDHRREAEGKPNVGREKAAAAIGGQALIPTFAAGADGSDWNDVAWIEGREAAQLALVAAIRIAEREQIVAGMGMARLSERSHDRDPAKERERAGAELER